MTSAAIMSGGLTLITQTHGADERAGAIARAYSGWLPTLASGHGQSPPAFAPAL